MATSNNVGGARSASEHVFCSSNPDELSHTHHTVSSVDLRSTISPFTLKGHTVEDLVKYLTTHTEVRNPSRQAGLNAFMGLHSRFAIGPQLPYKSPDEDIILLYKDVLDDVLFFGSLKSESFSLPILWRLRHVVGTLRTSAGLTSVYLTKSDTPFEVNS